MKHTLPLLLLICILSSCGTRSYSPQETITRYYTAFDQHDYNILQESLHDTLTIIEGDYTTTYTRASYRSLFKWDSVFNTSHKLLKFEYTNKRFIATVASSSTRNAFLKNNPLTCAFDLRFTSGKISQIETLDCPDTQWHLWQQERDSLVVWIKKEHPELDGFVNELTMQGAQRYLKAITLYQRDKNRL